MCWNSFFKFFMIPDSFEDRRSVAGTLNPTSLITKSRDRCLTGARRFNEDIRIMIGRQPSPVWSFCLCYLTPIVLIVSSLWLNSGFFQWWRCANTFSGEFSLRGCSGTQMGQKGKSCLKLLDQLPVPVPSSVCATTDWNIFFLDVKSGKAVFVKHLLLLK